MWNDGISKLMNDYLAELSDGGKIDLGQTYIDAVKKEIDVAIDDYANFVEPKIPVDTGGLKASFKIEKVTNKRNWYGYRAEFKGNAPNGEPYQKIANILNYGRAGKTAPTYFITRAIRRLKKVDANIEKRFVQDLKDKQK